VRFAYVTSLWVKGKQTLQTKDTIDTGNETASYKVLPLGDNFVVRTVCASLSATSPTRLISLLFTSNGSRAHRFAPTAVTDISRIGLMMSSGPFPAVLHATRLCRTQF
jgi:hypothetical protein